MDLKLTCSKIASLCGGGDDGGEKENEYLSLSLSLHARFLVLGAINVTDGYIRMLPQYPSLVSLFA